MRNGLFKLICRFTVFALLSVCQLPKIASAQSMVMEDEQRIIQNALIVTADQFVYPNYLAFAQASTRLQQALSTYCSAERVVEGSREQIHSLFASSFLAWQRASLIQIGAIMDAEGPMRFQLWPDPKGFSRRAVTRAVAKQSPELLEPGALKGRSIAMVNLTALEILLYGELSPETYPCALSVAIADYQKSLANQLANDWDPGSTYREQHDNTVAGNTRYPSAQDLLREYLAGAVVYTDRLKKFKLGRGLGDSKGDARAKRTEAVRSGLGLSSIVTSLETLADFLTLDDGIFNATKLLGGTDEHIVLASTLRTLVNDINLKTASLEDIATEDGELAQKLRDYAALLQYLEAYLKLGFFEPIGMTAGFSSADGD